MPAVTLELPAPVLGNDPNNRSIITPAGDLDGDGFDDIAVSVTKASETDKQGVYILFGRERLERAAPWKGPTAAWWASTSCCPRRNARSASTWTTSTSTC